MTTRKPKATTTPGAKARKTAKPPRAATAAPSTAKARAKPAAPAKPAEPAAASKPARRAASPPAAPAPAAKIRRAIFIDVENTSSEAALADALDALDVDRRTQTVELAAVGNWRAVGQPMARRLAALGAQLVHSAPAKGVRDWSDLWIAVAAGCWLGQASPGDVLEIISNDKAFEAVGDAAAARGVIYRLVKHRRGAAAATAVTEAKPAAGRSGSSRGGRRRKRAATPAASGASPASAAQAAHPHLEAHGATREQMIDVIRRLMHGDPHRWVNLDVLENELKREGFSRPPNSPRLVTRLRALKEVEVSPQGRVRLHPHGQD